MAKRKSKNKNFASRRAAESNAAQRQEAITTSVRNVIFGLIGLTILVGGIYYLIQFLNEPVAEEPAAIQTGTETGTGGTVNADGPTGTLMETDRPLAEIDALDRNDYYNAPPEMTIDTSKSYQALLTTDQGEMLIQLFDDEAPITVNNFVFLANQGFYDDLTFHRVIENFMVQGGDPAGVGNGGPGYSFEDEFDPNLRFDRRGLLAMANSGPATNGSQFFITHVPTDWLNDAHTIFGELISGDDTLGAIPISGEPGSPAKLIRVEIYEN